MLSFEKLSNAANTEGSWSVLNEDSSYIEELLVWDVPVVPVECVEWSWYEDLAWFSEARWFRDIGGHGAMEGIAGRNWCAVSNEGSVTLFEWYDAIKS